MKRVIAYFLAVCAVLSVLPWAAAEELPVSEELSEAALVEEAELPVTEDFPEAALEETEALPMEDLPEAVPSDEAAVSLEEAATDAMEESLPEESTDEELPEEIDPSAAEELPEEIEETEEFSEADEGPWIFAEPELNTRAVAQLHNLPHFEDVSESRWYYSYVRQSYEQGLMSGMSQTKFSPTGTMTRGMFVTVIGRIARVSEAEYKTGSVFTDVSVKAYYGPYVSWASQMGIVAGMDATHFMPERQVSREQAAVMLDRYLQTVMPNALTEVELPAYGDVDAISDWALESVARMQQIGLMQGDNLGNFNPKNQITRAEAATVFVRLNAMVYGSVQTVNNWFDRDLVPTVSNPIVTKANLESIIAELKLASDSPALQALISINTVYAKQIGTAQRTRPLLFLFEGCGASTATNLRFGAMAVLVKGGKIVYLDRYSSSIPDYPFDPIMNDDGQPMPTMQGGIYNVTAVNHKGYAAWHVNDCSVVRFRNQYSFYNSVSYYIRVHRRTKNVLAPYGGSWVNSCGCILIGKAGTDADDSYARFIQAIGLVSSTSAGNVPYQYAISGTFVLDRSLGKSYMQSLGYPAGSLKALGCP